MPPATPKNNSNEGSWPDPNYHVCSAIIASLSDNDEHVGDDQSRTELKSHANMVVIGKYSMVLNTTGRTANVRAFSPDLDTIEVAIVDAAIIYECPYGGQTHILICLNALYVPTMTNNLVPPFIMREAGVIVNKVPILSNTESDCSRLD